MAENFTVKRGEDGVFTIWFGETDVTSQVRRLVIEIYDTEPQVGGVQLVLNVPISLDLSLDDLTGPFSGMSVSQLMEVRTKLDADMHKRLKAKLS